MSSISGAKRNQDTLATQAGITAAQASQLSGADLMREALRVKGGYTAAQIAAMDGARLMQLVSPIQLGVMP